MENTRYSVGKINNSYYGVPLENLQEVCNIPKITTIPNSPSYFIGVFNLRGNVYGIVDFNLIIGNDKTEITKDSSIILLKNKQYTIGILVSKIYSVMSSSEIEENAKDSNSKLEMQRFISKKFSDDGIGDVFILNIENLLSSSELTIYC